MFIIWNGTTQMYTDLFLEREEKNGRFSRSEHSVMKKSSKVEDILI